MAVDVVPEAELLEGVELASMRGMVEAAAPELAGRLGLRYEPVGRAGALVCANADVPMFNRALGVGALEPTTLEVVERLAAAWDGVNVRRLVQVAPGVETPELRAALEARGFTRTDAWAKVWRGTDAPAALPTDLRVAEVGPEQAEALEGILAACFGLPGDLAALLRGTLGRAGWHTYMAFDGAVPVATGTLFVDAGAGALLAGATMPTHRRRGAQGAIMARRIQDGLALGCRTFVSEAAEDTPERPNPSYHNMLRTGFRLAYLRRNYVRFPD